MTNHYRLRFKQTAVTVLMAAACCFALSSQAATLYKWTDENGVVHFSEHPPAGVANVEKVRNHVARGNSPVQYNAPSTQSEAAETAEAQPTNAEAGQQRDPAVQKARCETARKNLDSLSSFVRIREKDENGELRFLSEEEVAERRQTFKDIVDKECGGS